MCEDVIFCRLCLKIVPETHVQKINYITRHMLDILGMSPNLDVIDELDICKNCENSLQNAVEFKKVCLETEDLIISLQLNPLDMRIVYMLKNNDMDETPFKNRKICRFCVGLVPNQEFKTKQQIDKGTLMKCLQKDRDCVWKPIVCMPCFSRLTSYHNLLETILETEEKINTFLIENRIDPVKNVQLNKVLQFHVRKEIQSKARQCRVVLVRETLHASSPKRHPTEVTIDPEMIHVDAKGIKWYQCPDCPYKTKKRTYHFKKHVWSHQKITGMKTPTLRCQVCSFQARSDTSLAMHLKLHTLSDMEVFKCSECQYMTLHESHIVRHRRLHRKEIGLHCDKCSFTTKYHGSLTNHRLTHYSYLENKFQCDRCCFRTPLRGLLKRHKLRHGAPDDWPKCAHCTFKCATKTGLISHIRLRHTDPHKTRMFMCEKCGHRAKQKANIETHMAVHRDSWVLHKCKQCDFTSKYLRGLQVHALQHEPLRFFCERCSYACKTNGWFTKHVRKHKRVDAERGEIKVSERGLQTINE